MKPVLCGGANVHQPGGCRNLIGMQAAVGKNESTTAEIHAHERRRS